MADSYIPYQNPSTVDKKLDSESLTVGSNTVERERIQVAGSVALEVAVVKNANPANNDYGLVVRDLGQRAATPSQSSVAGNASSVSLLAANAARLGATIYNDSTANLYVRLGSTASSSNFTIKLAPNDYYEVPFNYTGAINGIWDSATGNARITELTT